MCVGFTFNRLSFILIAVFCLSTPLRADDKSEHFIASYAIGFTAYQVTKSPIISWLGTIAIGAAKEFLIDKKASKQDMLYNAIGTTVGVSISIPFE